MVINRDKYLVISSTLIMLEMLAVIISGVARGCTARGIRKAIGFVCQHKKRQISRCRYLSD